MQVLQTERLILSQLSYNDTEFIIELLNDPSFIQYIGDKGVRTEEDAHDYFRTGPLHSYEAYGYGLFRTALTDGDIPIGICGLVKREYLADPDVGFALLPAYWSQGYALEAASAVIEWGRRSLGLKRIVGIVNPENRGSIELLEKLGLRFERSIRADGNVHDVSLYSIEFG